MRMQCRFSKHDTHFYEIALCRLLLAGRSKAEAFRLCRLSCLEKSYTPCARHVTNTYQGYSWFGEGISGIHLERPLEADANARFRTLWSHSSSSKLDQKILDQVNGLS